MKKDFYTAEHEDLSRRNFLRGSALAAAGLAVTGMAGEVDARNTTQEEIMALAAKFA